MALSTVGALTDLAAALVVSTRQWRAETSTSASAASIEDDIRAVEEQIDRVRDSARLSTSDRSKLDSVGTELWNAFRIPVMEACPDDAERKTMNGGVLAVLVALLDLASPSNAPGHVRVLEVTFEASRVCIDTDQLDCALKILKVAAKRFDSLKGFLPPIDQVQLDSISAEYYMLRVYVAWKQGRPDIADHHFAKVPLKATIKNRSTIVEQCLWIGRMALEAGQHEISAKWLETALGQLHENQDEALSLTEFDFHIRHCLACAYIYMSIDAPEAAAKLEGQMDVLKTQYGENPAVQYLELEMRRLGLNPENDKFFEIMKDLISRPDYTEQEFQNVIAYIQYSMRLSFCHAFEICQSLLKSLPYNRRQWIEGCLLQLPRIVGTLAHELRIPDEACIAVMKDGLAILEARGIECMSQETTEGFFTILLKFLQKSDGISCQHIAEKWCQLALDSKVFKGRFISANLGLQKRLAAVCFDNNNLALARQILDQIVAKNDSKCDPEVQYLLFKMALHDEKDVYLKDYLCELSNRSSPFDQLKFLRACAVAAEELNNSRLAIDCIQEFTSCTALVEDFPGVLVGSECKESLSVADACIFPLVFLFNQLEEGQGVSEMDALDLVSPVLGWVKRGLSSKNAAFSIDELQSVGLYSYNLAVHVFNMFPPEDVDGVLDLTREIFDLSMQRHESLQTTNTQPTPSNRHEEGSDRKEKSDSLQLGLIAYRFLYFEANTRIFCVHLIQIDASRKLEHYTKIRAAIKRIRDQTPEYSASHPLDTNSLQNLSIIEFEATVALKQWSAVPSIVRESEKFFNASVFNRFLDCIIGFKGPDAHSAITIKTMLEIIRRAGEVPPAVSDQLSTYSHFLFTFALAAAKSEVSARLPDISQKWPDAYYDMAESVIDEFLKSAGHTPDSKPYSNGDVPPGDSSPAISGPLESPTEEQEYLYLAKCSFNQAMDFYSADNDQACLRWAEKAILLAKSVRTPEGDELASVFRKRLGGLF